MTGAQLSELIDRPTAAESGSTADEVPDSGAPSRFTRELVEGVEAKREELDDLIEEQAIDWHVERIAPLELAILRVALYEIMNRADVPTEVSIDEAVETAKLYCGTQAPGFVNGILGGIVKRVGHA